MWQFEGQTSIKYSVCTAKTYERRLGKHLHTEVFNTQNNAKYKLWYACLLTIGK